MLKTTQATKRDLARMRRILKRHMPELAERYRVRSFGIFGSYAQNRQKKGSDLDLLVEFADDEHLSLLQYIELELYLSDLLGVKVDLVEKRALKPAIGRHILQEVKPL